MKANLSILMCIFTHVWFNSKTYYLLLLSFFPMFCRLLTHDQRPKTMRTKYVLSLDCVWAKLKQYGDYGVRQLGSGIGGRVEKRWKDRVTWTKLSEYKKENSSLILYFFNYFKFFELYRTLLLILYVVNWFHWIFLKAF